MAETAPTSVDESILAFARSWYRYGGGSEEDIYVQFGLAARSYFEKLARLLDGPASFDIDETVKEQMRTVCSRRLR